MKKFLNYEAPCSEELPVNLEKRFLTDSDYDPSNDRGNGAPPQGYYGGSYGEF